MKCFRLATVVSLVCLVFWPRPHPRSARVSRGDANEYP
jgi:hypothetical protein